MGPMSNINRITVQSVESQLARRGPTLWASHRRNVLFSPPIHQPVCFRATATFWAVGALGAPSPSGEWLLAKGFAKSRFSRSRSAG